LYSQLLRRLRQDDLKLEASLGYIAKALSHARPPPYM
jgi:hypothetical protein